MAWLFNLVSQIGNILETHGRSNNVLFRENEMCVHQASLNVRCKCNADIILMQNGLFLDIKAHLTDNRKEMKRISGSKQTAYLVEGWEGQSDWGKGGRFVEEKADSWQEVTTLNHFISTSHYTPNLPPTPPFPITFAALSSSPHPALLSSPPHLHVSFWPWLPCKVESSGCIQSVVLCSWQHNQEQCSKQLV